MGIAELTLRYPSGAAAVEGLDLEIPPGEIFGLLGLNGAGKSSLIKAIATLLRPATGQVRVFGCDTRTEASAVKRWIGVVPQENNLDTCLDVRHNLLFHCRYAGIPSRLAVQQVERWLSLLELRSQASHSVLHLSGGAKRKAMLAKAFVTSPRLLVLDEPTTGLDPGIRELFWAQVCEFRAAGGTVFLSTHYLEEAEAICDRIGILHRGRLFSVFPGIGRSPGEPGVAAAAFRDLMASTRGNATA